MLCKQGFPKNIWISSSTQLGEHPNFGLNAEEGFPYSGDRKLRFLFRLFFLNLKTIYSYFITITLITMSSQHSYKHFIGILVRNHDLSLQSLNFVV